jgi:hypothetical protein
MDTRAVFMAEGVPMGEKKECGGKAFAELQNQGALDGEIERFQFAVKDGKAAAGNITVPGENFEVLVGGNSRHFALAPGFLVAIGERTTDVFKTEQLAKQAGEVAFVANGRVQE